MSRLKQKARPRSKTMVAEHTLRTTPACSHFCYNQLYPCLSLAMVISLALGGLGCGTRPSHASDGPTTVDPITLEKNLHACRELCLPKTISAIRAQLGLDPVGPKAEGTETLQEILGAVQAECQKAGSGLSQVAPTDLLRAATNKGLPPGVLMDSDGHLHLLL